MGKILNGIDYFGINENGSATVYMNKTINIGNWNMDTASSISIAHSLSSTEWKTIRSLNGIIRNDSDTSYYQILPDGGGNLDSDCYINYFDSTNIYIVRKTGGFFDGADFNSTFYNRGFLNFIYKPD